MLVGVISTCDENDMLVIHEVHSSVCSIATSSIPWEIVELEDGYPSGIQSQSHYSHAQEVHKHTGSHLEVRGKRKID